MKKKDNKKRPVFDDYSSEFDFDKWAAENSIQLGSGNFSGFLKDP